MIHPHSGPAKLSLRAWLAAPVPAASIGFFRAAFGVVMLVEVARFFVHGWIARYYIEPTFHFTYYGFGWVRPWPGAGMYLHFVALGLASIGVAVGYRTRLCSVLLAALFGYVFLLEEARYLNHFYAALLFAFLLSVVPAARAISADLWRHDRNIFATIPRWCLLLLRFQVAVIYFFGGVAKLNADWMAGEPMRSWLVERADVPIIGMIVRHSLELALFSYGGLLFDLLVVPALLWRRTRPFAFVAAVVFHLINSQLFSIGIFPWMMLAATTLFFEPDWPARVVARLGRRAPAEPDPSPTRSVPMWVPAFLGVYALIQIGMPLRHFMYPGNVSWTEEGHLFAWHMKLRDKDGRVRFVVRDRSTGRGEEVGAEDELTSWQVAKMTTRPDLILQYAHHLAERRGGSGAVVVQARALVSLNGGQVRPMIDERVDLGVQPRTLWPAWWVTRDDEAGSGNTGVGIR